MGIYKNRETDFIQRTLRLVEQYEGVKDIFEFDEQYNHTLLINCLLGLIVLPKEKVLSHVPTMRLEVMKQDCLLLKTEFHPTLKTVRDLITELRNAVAHFNIDFHSINDSGLIDVIEFKNDEKNIAIAKFHQDELLIFIKFYGDLLLQQLTKYYMERFAK
jgi:hypothetical protein